MKRSLVLLFALLAGCEKPAGKPPSPPPAPSAAEKPSPRGSWVAATRRTLRTTSPTTGTFSARRMTRVGAQVNGRVEDVLVDVGHTVKKNQELVRLERRLFDIEKTQRAADIATAQVALTDAELNLERMKRLWEKPEGQEPSIPRKLFDDARAARDAAAARLDQARASLAWAEERLTETVIRAPYDAVVTRRFVDPGESVTSTPVTHLVELQDTHTLNLEFSLAQELLAEARPGAKVEFEAEGVPDSRVEGTIAVVFPSMDESTRTFRCRVEVDNAAGKFRPGLLAEVRLVSGEAKDVVVVPRRALGSGGKGWQVTVEGPEGQVERPVTPGVMTEEFVEIREGLREGDRVFVRD